MHDSDWSIFKLNQSLFICKKKEFEISIFSKLN